MEDVTHGFHILSNGQHFIEEDANLLREIGVEKFLWDQQIQLCCSLYLTIRTEIGLRVWQLSTRCGPLGW
ncbi:hypothetical protein E0H32_19755 [Rhizobium leguminosarum bv. viciae]|nr:hypothetical protein E0H32_19755 [Rhizobium leguminosarum bv. viciae]